MKADNRETVRVEIDVVRAIIDDAAQTLAPEKATVLRDLLDSHVEVVRLLRQKGTTIVRLRRLFGLRKTERIETVLNEEVSTVQDEVTANDTTDSDSSNATEHASNATSEDDAAAHHSPPDNRSPPAKKPRRSKGSGRRAAADYEGSEIFVPHEELSRGEPCRQCERGKVYPFRSVVLLVLRGQSPLAADKYRLEALRCNACGAVFNAEPPPEATGPKYRPSSIAIPAALHYTFGMPFHRQGKLQDLLGVPVPASTQRKLMNESEPMVRPVLEALERRAAMSHLIHIDDTYLKLLNQIIADTSPLRRPPKQVGPGRTGQFTTGILAVDREGHRVALFITGRQHAGENIVDLMKLRPPGLHPPIIMSDALSRKTSGLLGLMLAYYAYCLAHARRGIVDQLENFPREAQYVLRKLAWVFRVDKKARKLGLTGRQRKIFHRKHSRPVLKALKAWIHACFDERRIEPNSLLFR